MNTQPAVAGAAIMAGLIVGGGAYAARHGSRQRPAPRRRSLPAASPARVPAIPHVRLAHWHPIRLPRDGARRHHAA